MATPAYSVVNSSEKSISLRRSKSVTSGGRAVSFDTENEAATYGLKQATQLNNANEVAGFVVRKSGKYEITKFTFSPIRDEVNPGAVPVLATAVFHTHVNDQEAISIGDEGYARKHQLNIYMYNTKHKVSDFKNWQDCQSEFAPLEINP